MKEACDDQSAAPERLGFVQAQPYDVPTALGENSSRPRLMGYLEGGERDNLQQGVWCVGIIPAIAASDGNDGKERFGIDTKGGSHAQVKCCP